jgi:hypothetical protein
MLGLRSLFDNGILRPTIEPDGAKKEDNSTGSAMKSNVNSILVLGTGKLGEAILKRLQNFGLSTTGTSAQGAIQDEVLRLIAKHNADVVVCSLEGTPGAAFVEINSALVKANTKAIFVLPREHSVEIGPTFNNLPSCCLVCSRVHSHQGDPKTDWSSFHSSIIPAAGRLFTLLDFVATEVGFEVERLTGGGSPWFSGGVLRISDNGDRNFEESSRTVRCPACGAAANASSNLTSFLSRTDQFGSTDL